MRMGRKETPSRVSLRAKAEVMVTGWVFKGDPVESQRRASGREFPPSKQGVRMVGKGALGEGKAEGGGLKKKQRQPGLTKAAHRRKCSLDTPLAFL